MITFQTMEGPLEVDQPDLDTAIVPDARHGDCWQHRYDDVAILAWQTPGLGGVTLAITGDTGKGADFIEDSVLFSMDATSVDALIANLAFVRGAMSDEDLDSPAARLEMIAASLENAKAGRIPLSVGIQCGLDFIHMTAAERAVMRGD